MTNYPMPTAIDRLDLPEAAQYAGKSVRTLERELEATPLPGDFFLDATYANTNRFPAPEYALEAFTKAASGDGMTYTPYVGDASVREAVAANIEKYFGVKATGNSSVILTPGTQGALFIALASILDHGDRVILPTPDYLSTERTLRYFGAEVIHVPVIYEDTQGRPTLDPEALQKAAEQSPRLLIFSHPNNPTGAVYSDDTLNQIAELSKKHDFLVLADQLYARLVYDGESFTHLANLAGMEDRTITTFGPSKTESLSGYRLGVAVAPNELIERMEDVQSVTALRAPAYAQHVLTHWLAKDGDYVAGRTKEYQALRDWTVKTLNDSGMYKVSPSWGT